MRLVAVWDDRGPPAPRLAARAECRSTIAWRRSGRMSRWHPLEPAREERANCPEPSPALKAAAEGWAPKRLLGRRGAALLDLSSSNARADWKPG